jgi:hypothetical protein
VLAALYVGFIGRIVLKDFRDVVGDQMFGKRTFLVRHGRRVTCAVSGACWVSGTVLLVAATPGAGVVYAACQAVAAAVAAGLIVALAGAPSHRREERLVSAVAIVGRASVASVFLQVTAERAWVADLTVVAVTLLSLVLVGEMLRLGPRQPRLTVTDSRVTPSAVVSAATGSSSSAWRGLRAPANDVTATSLLRPDPSIRQ